MEVEEVDPEYKDAAGSEDIGSSDAAIPAPVEKGPARPQKQVAQEAPSVHVLKAAVQLGVCFILFLLIFLSILLYVRCFPSSELYSNLLHSSFNA